SAAADFTSFSAPETLGIYRRCEIAMLFNSAFDARYFFSTDNLAAADGFVSTHLAAFSKARVAAAEAFGFLARNFPFTRTAQQYSVEYGKSAAWSAMLRTLPWAMSMLPMGSESATASTSPLSRANPSSPDGNTSQVTSLPGSMPFEPSTRLAKMKGGVPMPGTPMRLPRKSWIERMFPFAPAC